MTGILELTCLSLRLAITLFCHCAIGKGTAVSLVSVLKITGRYFWQFWLCTWPGRVLKMEALLLTISVIMKVKAGR